jgi:hypothetical protein
MQKGSNQTKEFYRTLDSPPCSPAAPVGGIRPGLRRLGNAEHPSLTHPRTQFMELFQLASFSHANFDHHATALSNS